MLIMPGLDVAVVKHGFIEVVENDGVERTTEAQIRKLNFVCLTRKKKRPIKKTSKLRFVYTALFI